MPAQADVENLYFSLADLSLEDQRQQMWALSSTTKAALWTYNAERYLRNHPELEAEAQEMLRRGTALINTPAWFDIQQGSVGYPAKKAALLAFKQEFEKVLSPEIIYEVLIRLGPNPEEESSFAPEERPRAKMQSEGSMFSCSCGSGFDAQYANEVAVSAGRIVAALVQTDSIKEFCAHARIDATSVLDALENEDEPPFAECERWIDQQLAAEGIAFGSARHLASMHPRPMEASVRHALDPVIAQGGAVDVSPLELLLKLIGGDPSLAERLSRHGLDAKTIRAALGRDV
jgi:hypothetical protein